MIRSGIHASILIVAALTLAGCISSTGPVLTDATPAFGTTLNLALYTLGDGHAREPQNVRYEWSDGLYRRAGGHLKDIAAFSVHEFENGDYVVQSVPRTPAKPTEFALAHKLADGVWQVVAIDEADADEATRSAYCDQAGGAACGVTTREALFAFARATAAQHKDTGGLAIVLEDRPARTKKR